MPPTDYPEPNQIASFSFFFCLPDFVHDETWPPFGPLNSRKERINSCFLPNGRESFFGICLKICILAKQSKIYNFWFSIHKAVNLVTSLYFPLISWINYLAIFGMFVRIRKLRGCSKYFGMTIIPERIDSTILRQNLKVFWGEFISVSNGTKLDVLRNDTNFVARWKHRTLQSRTSVACVSFSKNLRHVCFDLSNARIPLTEPVKFYHVNAEWSWFGYQVNR